MRTPPERLLLPAGLALVVLTAVVALVVDPVDAELVCARSGRCPGPATGAVLGVLGWVQGAGVLAVVAGLAQRVLARPAGPVRTRVGPALAAAVLGAGLWVVTAGPALFAAFVGPHVFTAVAVLGLLLTATTVTALLDGRGPRERAAALTGPVAAVVAAAVTVAAVVRPLPGGDGPWADPLLSALLHGAVLSGVVLLGGGPRRTVAVVLAAVLAVVTLLAVQALAPVRPLSAAQPTSPVTRSTPVTTPAAVPLPPPTTDPPPVPVRADVVCAPGDLRFDRSEVDGAVGLRAIGLLARYTGTSACWSEGVPALVLVQGGRPLRLAVTPGQLGDPTPAGAERVGLAPGAAASVLLTRRSHGGWADGTTPQTLALVPVAGGSPVEVPLGGGAPIDVVDGAQVGLTGWRPA